MNTATKTKAFTIVEMMVVVVILGILAGLVVLGYTNWQRTAASKAVQSDLQLVAVAMENAKNFGSGYPTAIPATFTSSPNVEVDYYSGDASTFCVDAMSTSDSSIRYFIDTSQGKTPLAGTCATGVEGSGSLGAPQIAQVNLTFGKFFNVYWDEVQGAQQYEVQYKNGSTWQPYMTLTDAMMEESIELDGPGNFTIRIRSVGSGAQKSGWTQSMTFTMLAAPSQITRCQGSQYNQTPDAYSWTTPAAPEPINKFHFTWQGGASSSIVAGQNETVTSLDEPSAEAQLTEFYGISESGQTATMPRTGPIAQGGPCSSWD